MKKTWEQWRMEVLHALDKMNISIDDARAIMEEEDGYLRQCFADGGMAGSAALDLDGMLTDRA